jgi:hypothetical protein
VLSSQLNPFASITSLLLDNHENIPQQLPVPGKAIVYKGSSPVQPTPFTFENYCAKSTDSTGTYWDSLPQPPTVSQIETFIKVHTRLFVYALPYRRALFTFSFPRAPQ